MALGTTNISIPIVKTALVENTDNLLLLCQSNNINKWSRYKPVREAGFGTEPPDGAGASGLFGLDVFGNNNWEYLKPRGGSWGGSPDEPGRLGDFRKYEHDKDVAGPVMWVLTGSPTLTGTLIPHTSPSGYLTGAVTFNINTAADDVRITPADLGLDNYYFGIRLQLPDNSYQYKTIGYHLLNSQTIGVNVTLVNPTTDPSFVDCPYDIGAFTWQVFISSESTSGWQSSAPSGLVWLPTGTYGSKTIINSGGFTVSDWLIASNNDMTFDWNDESFLNPAHYQNAIISTSLPLADNWEIKSIPEWMNFKVFDETLDRTSYPDQWDNGFTLRLVPDLQEYGAVQRSGDIIIGSSSVNMEWIHVVQARAPKKYTVGNVIKWASDSSNLAFSGATGYIIEGQSTVTISINKSAGPTTLYYKVVFHGTQVNREDIVGGWGQLNGCNNGTIELNLTCTTVADDSCTPIMVTLSGTT